MSSIVSRTISVRQEHELLLKLEQAGLDGELAQFVIGSSENRAANATVQFLREEMLRSIMEKLRNKAVPTWKVIKIGNFRDVADLKKAFAEVRLKYTDYFQIKSGFWLMDQSGFTLCPKEMEVGLVKVSGKELEFTRKYSLRELFLRACDFMGLEPCEAEDAPQLRYQYLNQPGQEFLSIATNPISTEGSGSFIFTVDRVSNELRLFISAVADMDFRCEDPDTTWVFRQRKAK